ncbi:hypothetical protein [Algoriphagus confluentis]|uniref:Lipoprotein n=1 Tax=Algoriphagus confluentis TaxID=1697556 RepID=A0ABQ6PUB7_9BACT|nr:hypothetical protein Aconfl_41620 [Algoriphagus confluentis]
MNSFWKSSICRGAIFGLFIFLLFSCSETEQEPSDDYFISAKLSGQSFKFQDSATGVVEARSFSAFAGQNPTSNFPSFSFDIESLPISVGEFKESDSGLIMIFRYSLSGTETFHSQMGEEGDFVIRISSLTEKYIEGSFSGTIRGASNSSQFFTVSEGKFRLKRS